MNKTKLTFIFLILFFLCQNNISRADQPAPQQIAIVQQSLSLNEAIHFALKNNLIMRLARERINEAKGKSTSGNSDLLPHIGIEGYQMKVQRFNLQTMGLPGLLGPFDAFDARLQLEQRIFDLSAFSKSKAENLAVEIARYGEDLAHRQVMTQAIMAYLNVLKNAESLKTIDENISVAEKFVKLSEHQRAVGMATQVDEVRAETRLAQEKAAREKILFNLQSADFNLKRVTGIALDCPLRLTDTLLFFVEPAYPVQKTLDEAFNNRVEITIAEQRVEYKKLKLQEAKSLHLPKISLVGDYGTSGVRINRDKHEVGEFGIKASFPIFEGGAIEGQIMQETSIKKQEEMTRDDVSIQIEEDVRLSLQILQTSLQAVYANDIAQKLSSRELEYTKNQYINGLEDNLKVDAAQSDLAQTKENYITALAQYHTGRVNYYSAIGKLEQFSLNQPEVNHE
ncbi:MAG: TolC family protein [Candidatus Omnitrophica bacterium]|nr:TolC family protein [Candidatus Omnitrophota bacterium]